MMIDINNYCIKAEKKQPRTVGDYKIILRVWNIL